jgi:hypothetical protein
VLKDPDLTLNEKRAILASWASDACAVEAAPALRRAPDGRHVVTVASMRYAPSTGRTRRMARKGRGRDARCDGGRWRRFATGAPGETRVLCRNDRCAA